MRCKRNGKGSFTARRPIAGRQIQTAVPGDQRQGQRQCQLSLRNAVKNGGDKNRVEDSAHPAVTFTLTERLGRQRQVEEVLLSVTYCLLLYILLKLITKSVKPASPKSDSSESLVRCGLAHDPRRTSAQRVLLPRCSCLSRRDPLESAQCSILLNGFVWPLRNISLSRF